MKIHVADDHKLFISGVDSLLQQSNMKVSSYSLNGKQTIEALIKKEIDVLLLDISLPLVDGFGVLKFIKNQNINVKTIVISAFNGEKFILDSIRYGVKGYILKEDIDICLATAVRNVYHNKEIFSHQIRPLVCEIKEKIECFETLSKKEKDIVDLFSKRLNPKEIQQKLDIKSQSTFRTYTERIRKKLNILNNAGIAKYLDITN